MLSLALYSLLVLCAPGPGRAAGASWSTSSSGTPRSSAGSSRRSRCSCRSGSRPATDGEDVRFPTADGLELAGTYLRARTGEPRGRARLLPRIPERSLELSTLRRRAPRPGLRHLHLRLPQPRRERQRPGYQPLQWVTDHEVRDLEAALAYLRSRPDRDPAGFGLFGVSRGGGTALVRGRARARRLGRRSPTARSRPAGRCSPTSSAGPRSTSASRVLYAILRDYSPRWVFALLGWVGQCRAERRLLLPLPERRTGRGAARAAPLADDPRRQGRLHRPGDRRSGCSGRGGRAQGTLDRARGQAQPLPRGRRRRLRRTGRVVPRPVRPPRPSAAGDAPSGNGVAGSPLPRGRAGQDRRRRQRSAPHGFRWPRRSGRSPVPEARCVAIRK